MQVDTVIHAKVVVPVEPRGVLDDHAVVVDKGRILAVVPVAEGLGEARAVAPGATALFGFEVTRAGPVGVGIRSEPDRAMVRLLDATGKPLGEGVAQLHRLDPGRYFVEARIPATGRTTTIRPAVIGIKPPPAGPPPEVTLQYLEMVGLKPPHSP